MHQCFGKFFVFVCWFFGINWQTTIFFSTSRFCLLKERHALYTQYSSRRCLTLSSALLCMCICMLYSVIDAASYLENFSSDRLHMYDPITKVWNAPPPPYPCILPHPDRKSNLGTYINMAEVDGPQNVKQDEKSSITTTTTTTPTNNDDLLYGKVYTLETLQSRFLLS